MPRSHCRECREQWGMNREEFLTRSWAFFTIPFTVRVALFCILPNSCLSRERGRMQNATRTWGEWTRMLRNAWGMWSEPLLFSIRIFLFSTFATVETGHKWNSKNITSLTFSCFLLIWLLFILLRQSIYFLFVLYLKLGLHSTFVFQIYFESCNYFIKVVLK